MAASHTRVEELLSGEGCCIRLVRELCVCVCARAECAECEHAHLPTGSAGLQVLCAGTQSVHCVGALLSTPHVD